jgi:hypothetical protein
LADTFTTPYFAHLAEVTQVPEEFVADMRDKWGVDVEQGSKVFDMFRCVSTHRPHRSNAQILHGSSCFTPEQHVA